jgi:O-acetyl-ADP-ribose deacetylase (regulator of RNase III)
MHEIARWLKGWAAEPLPWDQVGLFKPGDYILERLLAISQEVDGALIIFGDEDKKWYHADAQPQPRDNVLIEYGIFASQLGRERVVVCRTGNPKDASDLGGLIHLQLARSKASQDETRDRLRDWVRRLPDLMVAARDEDKARREKAAEPVAAGADAVYHVGNAPGREVRIQTGALKNLRNVDVMVSSENTDLQPARFYDRSMSGTLRYLDGERDKGGRVVCDVYLETLSDTIKRENVTLPVMAGSVIAMPAHGLAAQGVKFIFHAAIAEGRVGAGYGAQKSAIEDAVCHSFERFAELAAQTPLRSILFPMFGTGTARLSEDVVARCIVGAIDAQLRQSTLPATIYLYALIEAHRVAFARAAEAMGWISA